MSEEQEVIEEPIEEPILIQSPVVRRSRDRAPPPVLPPPGKKSFWVELMDKTKEAFDEVNTKMTRGFEEFAEKCKPKTEQELFNDRMRSEFEIKGGTPIERKAYLKKFKRQMNYFLDHVNLSEDSSKETTEGDGDTEAQKQFNEKALQFFKKGREKRDVSIWRQRCAEYYKAAKQQLK